MKPHVPTPSTTWHVGAPFAGTGQGAQLAPHELTLVLLRHWPPQSCVPGAHMFMQGCVEGWQDPAQST